MSTPLLCPPTTEEKTSSCTSPSHMDPIRIESKFPMIGTEIRTGSDVEPCSSFSPSRITIEGVLLGARSSTDGANEGGSCFPFPILCVGGLGWRRGRAENIPLATRNMLATKSTRYLSFQYLHTNGQMLICLPR